MWVLLASAPAVLDALADLDTRYGEMDFRLRQVARMVDAHNRAWAMRGAITARYQPQHRRPPRWLQSVPGGREAV